MKVVQKTTTEGLAGRPAQRVPLAEEVSTKDFASRVHAILFSGSGPWAGRTEDERYAAKRLVTAAARSNPGDTHLEGRVLRLLDDVGDVFELKRELNGEPDKPDEGARRSDKSRRKGGTPETRKNLKSFEYAFLSKVLGLSYAQIKRLEAGDRAIRNLVKSRLKAILEDADDEELARQHLRLLSDVFGLNRGTEPMLSKQAIADKWDVGRSALTSMETEARMAVENLTGELTVSFQGHESRRKGLDAVLDPDLDLYL